MLTMIKCSKERIEVWQTGRVGPPEINTAMPMTKLCFIKPLSDLLKEH